MRTISFNIAAEDEKFSSLLCASSQDNKKSTLARKNGRRIGRSGSVEGETHIWFAGNPESPSSSCQAIGYKKKTTQRNAQEAPKKRLPRSEARQSNFLR